MIAPLLISLGLACLVGAMALTLAGVRHLLVRPHKTAIKPFGSLRAPAAATLHMEGTGLLPLESGVLLNTLWEHLPNAECQAGECGGCKVRLLEGRVRWIRDPVVELNRKTHFLACSCEAVGSIRCAAA